MTPNPKDSGRSPEDRSTLAALLDAIIPASADGRKPGAGALGIEASVSYAVQEDAIASPVFASLLDSLRSAARDLGVETIAELDEEVRTEIVRRVESEIPEAFARVVAHTCVQYYQNAEVVSALGLEARPPFPTGFEVAPTNPALLDPVRGRDPMYRKC
jgi:hypothetical protein